MSSADEKLHARLQQLQSRFTWGLKKEDLELDDLSRQLEHDVDLQLGQRGAVAHSYSFLAYVRYLQNQSEETLSLLSQSEKKTKECYGENSERRLIVTYGDLAWLKYLTGDKTESQAYCQRVEDILVKHPTESSTVLLPEVYGEKAWTFLKFSKSYYPKAIECFCRALELQPDDCEFNNGYAIALYRTEPYVTEPGTEESLGTKQLRRAVKINPKDGVLLSMLSLKLLQLQKYREADGLVERALLQVRGDDTQISRYVAKYLRLRAQVDRSIDLLQKVLKTRIQSAFIHHQLALCYNRKRTDLLSKKVRPARERPLESSTSTRTAGRKQQLMRDSDGLKLEVQHWRHLSIHHLEEAIRLKCTLNHAKADLALLYAEEGDVTRAQRMFDEALKKLDDEPNSIRQAICQNYAEFCNYHTYQKDLAIIYYKKVLDFGPSTSSRKFIAKKLKQIAEQRLRRNPRDAAAYGLLGDVAKAEGDHVTAMGYYRNALEHEGDNEDFLSALGALRLDDDPRPASP